jgi:type I restriction enzyme S subunit
MVKYLRAANVKDGRLDLKSVMAMNFDLREQEFYALRQGDVLVTEGCGSPIELGASARWNDDLAGTVCFQNTLLRLRARPGVSDPAYLYLLARWCYSTGAWLTASSGTSILHIGHTRAKRVPVPVPPLDVQRKIGFVVAAYDELIENNNRRIKLLEEIAQHIFREWFVDFRYPGHESDQLVDSELGLIPDGWSTCPLSTLVSTQYGYTESATSEPIGPRFLRGMDINKKSYIDWSTVPFCLIAPSDIDRYRLVRGDVLVIRMADPGKVGIVEQDENAVFASYLIRVRPFDSRIDPYVLFYVMSSDRYQSFVMGASTGTTRKSLSAPLITSISIALPPSELQALFVNRIAPLRDLITGLVRTNTTLRNSHNLLLPRLISGEIDISSLDIVMPVVAA